MKHIWNRRDFLFQSSGGIAGLALTQMLSEQKLLAQPAAYRRLRRCPGER